MHGTPQPMQPETNKICCHRLKWRSARPPTKETHHFVVDVYIHRLGQHVVEIQWSQCCRPTTKRRLCVVSHPKTSLGFSRESLPTYVWMSTRATTAQPSIALSLIFYSNDFDASHIQEMMIAGYHREIILLCDSGDPDVIIGCGLANGFEALL